MRSKPPKKCSKTPHRAAKVPVAKDPPRSTWDVAEELLQKTPPTVLGISRPVFLGLLGGLASLARDFIGEGDPTVDEELRRVEKVCLAASIMDLAGGGATPAASMTRGEKLNCAACMCGYGAHAHPARVPAVNSPGGSDVRTS